MKGRVLANCELCHEHSPGRGFVSWFYRWLKLGRPYHKTPIWSHPSLLSQFSGEITRCNKTAASAHLIILPKCSNHSDHSTQSPVRSWKRLSINTYLIPRLPRFVWTNPHCFKTVLSELPGRCQSVDSPSLISFFKHWAAFITRQMTMYALSINPIHKILTDLSNPLSDSPVFY